MWLSPKLGKERFRTALRTLVPNLWVSYQEKGLCSCSTTNAVTGSVVPTATEVKPDSKVADSYCFCCPKQNKAIRLFGFRFVAKESTPISNNHKVIVGITQITMQRKSLNANFLPY